MVLSLCSDVSPAAWFAGDPSDWAVRACYGPQVFPTYLRVALRDPEGSLPVVLRGVLAEHTNTPDDCYHGLWEGYSGIDGDESYVAMTPMTSMMPLVYDDAATVHRQVAPAFPRWFLDGPKVEIPNRAYYLFRGPLADIGTWPVSPDADRPPGFLGGPNLLWPADRAWFVAAEIDVDWTGVGGSVGLLRAVLADDRFDARQAEPLRADPYAD